MRVWQIRLKLYLLENIPLNGAMTEVTRFIDKVLVQREETTILHEENHYKGYCFDLPYPCEDGKTYLKDKVVSLTIRTVNHRLARIFTEDLVNISTKTIKGLTAEIKIIPPKMIEKVFSLTPVVLKSEQGYWRTHMSIAQFEQRLKENLIKKWNLFEQTKIQEDFQLYSQIDFLNEKPIPVKYKDITLLGDKINLFISENSVAQQLFYMSLGTGVLENNSRGFGFVNFRWI